MQCLKCGTTLEPGERFCSECGTAAEDANISTGSFCSECGSKLDAGARFCAECGAVVEAGAPAAERPLAEPANLDNPPPPEPAPPQTPIIKTVSPARADISLSAPVEEEPDERGKKSILNAKLLGLIVVVAAVGAAAVAMSLKSIKPTSPEEAARIASVSDQPPVLPIPQQLPRENAEAVVPNVSGQALVDASTRGDSEKFKVIFQQLQRREGPETGDRKTARKLNEAALMALREKSYAQAVDVLRLALVADPADIEVADNLGYALQMAGQFKEAETQLVAVIERAPDRASAWANLAEASSRLGKSKQAVAAYLTAYKFSQKPERLLETMKKMAEASEDENSRKNVVDALQRIEGPK
jgi:hypothetical protein